MARTKAEAAAPPIRARRDWPRQDEAAFRAQGRTQDAVLTIATALRELGHDDLARELISRERTGVPFDAEDAKWDASFAASQDVLARLAEEALKEARVGRTEPLDPDAI